MWSRVVEVMLGCWLVISPFIFLTQAERTGWWFSDMLAGTLVMSFALLSYWPVLRHAHLLIILVASGLIGVAYWNGYGDAPPASQNQMVLGILLLMFAIIPNDASDPPKGWDQRRLAESTPS